MNMFHHDLLRSLRMTQADSGKTLTEKKGHSILGACSQSILDLRLDWPATEWETGPEPKKAEKWPGSLFFRWGSPKMAERWANKSDS